MGLLLGFSFAASFALLGLPAGYLVDRMSRRKIMGFGIVLWSPMTLSCGLAQTYWQFFVGRSGIGVGEAALTPATYSLIRDGIPSEQRGRAFGIYSAGTYIGAAAGVMVTGALVEILASGKLRAVPWLGGLHAWQAVLVIIGAIGIPMSLLVLTFRQPLRRLEGSMANSVVTFREAIDQAPTSRSARAFSPRSRRRA